MGWEGRGGEEKEKEGGEERGVRKRRKEIGGEGRRGEKESEGQKRGEEREKEKEGEWRRRMERGREKREGRRGKERGEGRGEKMKVKGRRGEGKVITLYHHCTQFSYITSIETGASIAHYLSQEAVHLQVPMYLGRLAGILTTLQWQDILVKKHQSRETRLGS